jgi:ketosteroid isomerase-like protein
MTDLEDLQATFTQLIEALSARDADTASHIVHDEVVLFHHLSPFPVDGQATFRHALQQTFAYRESEVVTPINPQFRVIGATGLAWGHSAVTKKPKDGPLTTEFLRYTWVFTKTDEGWRVVVVHNSRLPT